MILLRKRNSHHLQENFNCWRLTPSVKAVLNCPFCSAVLVENLRGEIYCCTCDTEYPINQFGCLDLRPQKPKDHYFKFPLNSHLLAKQQTMLACDPMQINPDKEVDFSAILIPRHLTKEILSFFPKAKSRGSLALDMGCGGGIHRGVIEHAGFTWVGLDYDSKNAPILGDAHSLPFMNESFEFILSIAVFEHLRFPFLAAKEAFRVLKPGGYFIGTVAFLEPFHGESFYHHSHLGVINLLDSVGFVVQRVAASSKHSVLMASATMALFPSMPKFLCSLLILPIEILSKLWWRTASIIKKGANESVRVRNSTAAFTFIAIKDASR